MAYTPISLVDPGDLIQSDIENAQSSWINETDTLLGTDPQGSYTTIADAIDAKLDTHGGTMSGAIDMGSHGITNLATPASSGDAATKDYVDTLANLPTSGEKAALAGSRGTPGSSNLYVTQQDRAVYPISIEFSDDFLGAKEGRWNVGGTGGTYTQNSEADGTGTLATGSTTNNLGKLTFGGKTCFSAGMSPRMLCRAKISATTNIKVFVGLWIDSNTGIFFQYNETTPAGNLKCVCVNSGTRTTVDSGVAADTSYHYFEFDANGTTSVSFALDGTPVATISTNIPSSALEPIIFVQTQESADKQLTVDLYHIDGDRV
jgi:hypothetical protein